MNDTPKRRFWQIHLSTAVVLMFVAGGFMWLNSRPDVSIEEGEGSIVYSLIRVYRYGCPATMYISVEDTNAAGYMTKDNKFEVFIGDLTPSTNQRGWHLWIWSGLSIDALVAIATLFGGVIVVENRIRRREARKL
jgi:hypothetical protein